MCFSRELWVRRKRKETTNVKWKIKNATGRFLVQMHLSCFVSKIVYPVPKIAIEECFVFLHLFHIGWPCKHYNFPGPGIISRRACMIFGAQNAGNGISELPVSKVSGGAYPQTPPPPPQVKGPDGLLPIRSIILRPLTSCLLQIIFIETPGLARDIALVLGLGLMRGRVIIHWLSEK